MSGACSIGDAYILVGKPEGKRSLGSPRSRRDIKIGLKERGCDDVDWIRDRFL
jgi:hypothetical protein